MKRIAALCGLSAGGLLAIAGSPNVDGVAIDASDYGASVAVQDTNTRFGNNVNELNQLFVTSDSANIYLGMPGNLSDNNTLMVFIDTDGAAGSADLLTELGGPCPGDVPTILRHYDESTLDFTPNHALTISVGTFPGQGVGADNLVFASDLTNLNTLANEVLGIGAVNSGNGLLTGDSGVQIAIDTSNAGGVGAWDPNFPTPADSGDDPTDTTTGIEIAIPRALIGLAGPSATDVGFFAFITNNAQDGGPGPCFRQGFASNQGLPGLDGADNLGVFQGVFNFLNFTTIANPQVVAVTIPAP